MDVSEVNVPVTTLIASLPRIVLSVVTEILLVDSSTSEVAVTVVTVPPVAVMEPSSTYLTITIPEPPSPARV